MASTRKIVVFDRISADGYFSAADGALDWAVPDADLDKGAAGKLGDSDTMLFGRRTYDMFESFWPNVMKDPATAPDPHSPGRHTPEMRALAVWINAAKKIVFSTTRKKVSWTNSELRRDIVPGEIEALKAQPGKTIMLFGSGSVVSRLSELGLIDEYQFVVCPVLLGGGRQLVSGMAGRVSLELLEARPFTSGNVMLRFAPKR
jgi:dihydrofolate reductase